ncbi:MAG: hypothetical protein MJK13_17705 [Pseudomonadales bacterium]|nr:hypothetical protein [Pseudomonadales bacterium]
MKLSKLLITSASILLLQFSSSAQAFQCPAHLAAAQSAIDKVAADMKAMHNKLNKQQVALVHALLDDAKMRMHSAAHNHDKPQGAYDHARSLAKADTALGYANAADLLMQNYLK